MKFLDNFFTKFKPLILPSIIIILICQLVAVYIFWDIDRSLSQFKKDEIINIKIIKETEKRYKPGKSSSRYLEIELENGKTYPILLVNDLNKSEIKIGSYITKKEFSSEFWINRSIGFRLKSLSNERIFNHLFMLLISTCGIYGLYLETKKKD